MTHRVLWIVSAAAVFGIIGGAYKLAAQDKPGLPAAKVLEARSGVWDTETTAKPTDLFPNGFKWRGVETNESILGGKFQQTKNANRPDFWDNTLLVTYDAQKKVFRNWFFDDQGNTATGTGAWDEESKTLKWNPLEHDGFRTEGYWRFVDKDTYEWVSVTKDQSGKVVSDVTCKLKRRK